MTEHEQILRQRSVLEDCVRWLGEDWDTVQVFVTRHEPGTMDGTISIEFGVGNIYARLGHVKDWIVKQTEYTNTQARKEMEK